MSKEFTILFTRQEVEWMYRRFNGDYTHCKQLIDVLGKKEKLNDAEKMALETARDNVEMLETKVKEVMGIIGDGMKSLGALKATKEELEERLRLTDEPHAKQVIEHEISQLKHEEEYRITMNRHFIKYMIQVIDATLDALKTKVLPEYKSRPDAYFETQDRPRTRSYYINKATRDQVMIEDIRTRLEKRL